MNSSRGIFAIFGRLRLPGAFLCALVALPMIWTGLGFSPLQVLPGNAQAEAARSDGRDAALAVMPEERVKLLQASVDSVALGLGGALAPAGDEALKRRTLAGALSALTASLGADIYFTAWQGTRILHSPGNLDAAGLDFAAALDGRGAPFVLGMEKLGREQGGFLRVLLPPQRRSRVPDQDRAAGAGSEKDAGHLWPSGPALCPLDKGACPTGHEEAGDGADVEQVLYVRGIPGSNWHIAAFLPASGDGNLGSKAHAPCLPATPDVGEAFSSVWQKEDSTLFLRQERFLKGLRISGFSLAGLAGLLLLPAARGAAKARANDEEGADVS